MNNLPPPAPLGATPRTDGQADDPYSIHLMNGRAERHDVAGRKEFGLKLIPFVVDIDFARTLERENATLLAETKRLKDALQAITRRVPIMGSTGDYREGQTHALEACRDVARSALCFPAAETERRGT